eukprot:2695285-Rhodomonas_salina.2
MEEEGYNWYKSQESKKSMFGRTLNPLTGALEVAPPPTVPASPPPFFHPLRRSARSVCDVRRY